LHNAITRLRINGIEYRELKLTPLKERLAKCREECDEELRFFALLVVGLTPTRPSFKLFCCVGNWQF